ncbi:hypothetical protein [Streptomyces acidiscabies]
MPGSYEICPVCFWGGTTGSSSAGRPWPAGRTRSP